MANASFSNNSNTPQMLKPFGYNIITREFPYERTAQQAVETLEHIVTGAVNPFLIYLENNQSVFTGEVANEINKLTAELFNTGAALRLADEQMNGGNAQSLDMHF